jgi:hypothetical protein
MKPNPNFSNQSKEFWANIRLISEVVGYTIRGKDSIKIPTLDEIIDGYASRNSSSEKIFKNGKITELGNELLAYFDYRAQVLNNFVQEHLQDKEEAERLFHSVKQRVNPPSELIPMNKQKAEKKNEAFLTATVNMLIYEALNKRMCFDHDPRNLTVITDTKSPVRTFSRRFDGAYPSVMDPKVLWEIKEYYYTTTFGSRVADGVYESLLDGMEMEETEANTGIKLSHYLIVDSRFTWWVCGKSYLCRLIDMLNMGYVDVILFGKEVVAELPRLVKNEWIKT